MSPARVRQLILDSTFRIRTASAAKAEQWVNCSKSYCTYEVEGGSFRATEGFAAEEINSGDVRDTIDFLTENDWYGGHYHYVILCCDKNISMASPLLPSNLPWLTFAGSIRIPVLRPTRAHAYRVTFAQPRRRVQTARWHNASGNRCVCPARPSSPRTGRSGMLEVHLC